MSPPRPSAKPTRQKAPAQGPGIIASEILRPNARRKDVPNQRNRTRLPLQQRERANPPDKPDAGRYRVPPSIRRVKRAQLQSELPPRRAKVFWIGKQVSSPGSGLRLDRIAAGVG